jgi:predicted glycoside hydrolase/deacetylase ChbG (UPF0249 family)
MMPSPNEEISGTKPAIRLIVNADDYGYFPCVSRGIVQAASAGAISATGILANGPQLSNQIGRLAGYPNLDLGVHLNLTSRAPLTAEMSGKLQAWGGDFPGVFAMAGQILSRKIALETVRAEWRAQIETVLRLGLELRFLNSHEHIHMLPGLFTLARELAAEYKIPFVRLTRADWLPPYRFSAVLRSLVLQTLESLSRFHAEYGTPLFLGLGASGKLDLAYLQKLYAQLQPGRVYELMCHPGLYDPVEMTDSRLLVYHAWEAELALLTGPEVQGLYQKYGISVVNFRNIQSSTDNIPGRNGIGRQNPQHENP